jgi:hypothetical protein
MLVKIYGQSSESEKRYSPAECIGAVKHRVEGNPDPKHVSTSYAERQNLNVRMQVHAYADRIVIRQDGRIVGEHPRSFGRGDTVYDPWHYVPVLARKPGALRNGAPFKDWVLPAAMERVRRKLASADDGNRQMVDILPVVLTDGLPAVEAACAEAIAHGVHSADVVLNILARQRDPAPPATILTPAALTLRHAPIADCARYDNLRRTI